MAYEIFAQLVRLKFSLLRARHTAGPIERASLDKTVRSLDERLARCTNYADFIKLYAARNERIG